MKGSSLFFIFGTILLLLGMGYSNAWASTVYVYNNQTYESLASAEAAMRLNEPDGDDLQRCDHGIYQDYSAITYCYGDRPLLPPYAERYHYYSWGHSYDPYCGRGANSDYSFIHNPTGCFSEQHLESFMLDTYGNWGPGNSLIFTGTSWAGALPDELQPSYWSPLNFLLSDQNRWVVAGYSGDRTFTVHLQSAGGTPNDRVYTVSGETYRECPPNFKFSQDETEFPNVCKSQKKVSIRKNSMSNASSCPRTAYPCVPTTGDKLLVERDFTWQNLDFTRTYHSLSEVGTQSQFGSNWQHSLQQRVTNVQTGSFADRFLVNQNGDLVAFKKSAGAGTYKSTDGSGRVLKRLLPGPIWELDNGDGTVTHFNSLGLISRIINNNDPARSLEIVYNSNSRMDGIKSATGRMLFLSYEPAGLASDWIRERISRVSDESGTDLVRYGYDSNGRLTSVLRPDESTRTYHYGESTHVCVGESTSCDSSKFSNFITGVTDELGNRYSDYFYDDLGRVVKSTHADGANETLLHYESETSTLVQSPNSHARYNFNSGIERGPNYDGLYRSVNSKEILLGPDSHMEHWSRSADGGSVIYTNASGISERRVFDALGRLSSSVYGVKEVGGDQVFIRRVETDWVNSTALPAEKRVINGDGEIVNRTELERNTRGQVVSVVDIDPAGNLREVGSTYCEQADIDAGICPIAGMLLSEDGPRVDVADITTYTYRTADAPSCDAGQSACEYRKGDLWKVTNPLGQVTETLRYDDAGRPLSVKDPNGIATDYEYHPRGWLTATKVRGPDDGSEADDRITRIEYWPTGLVKKVTQPDGAFTTYGYDAAHRLTTIGDNAGNTIVYTLDNAGNRIQEETRDDSGALRRTLSRLYNQLGQLATQADASDNPTDFTYDPNGNLKTVTDPLGRATSNDYDSLNRLVRTLQDVGGIEAETAFEYDALDRLTKVTDPKGLETGYVYNAFGDLLQLDSPDTGTTTYTYDSAGNRTGQVDARGQASSYAYDALNRLTGIGYTGAADQNVTYVYDTAQPDCLAGETFAVGRLSAMADASGSTQYCYDRFGRLVRKAQVTNGQTFILRYAYTRSGLLSSLTYPDGSIADYMRDAQGRVTEVGVTSPGGSREVLLTDASYAPFGPATGWAYGNGRTLSRNHDLDYRPESILDGATGGLDFGYSYDPAGNLAALRTADLAEPPRATFDYDALNQLTAFKDGAAGTAIESYGYDATGNRTSFTNAGGSQPYTYPSDSHRLTGVAGVPRTYDAAGNTTAIGGTKEFVYNAANRLSQVKQGGTVTMHYVYNGKGERVRRHLGADDVTTVYDEAGRWLGDYDAAGIPLQQAIWVDDNPVGLLVGAAGVNRLHYVQPDHLGTPRAVIDPIRNVVVWNWDLASEAFGASPPNQDPDNDGTGFVFDMRFPGQRYDAASGLNYNYFRDYEPGTGRYPQSDPIGLDGGIATYSYAGGSPLMASDFYGLEILILPRPIFGPRPATMPRPVTTPRPFPVPFSPACPDDKPRMCKLLSGINHGPNVEQRFDLTCVYECDGFFVYTVELSWKVPRCPDYWIPSA